jgi:hypothetical protein
MKTMGRRGVRGRWFTRENKAAAGATVALAAGLASGGPAAAAPRAAQATAAVQARFRNNVSGAESNPRGRDLRLRHERKWRGQERR